VLDNSAIQDATTTTPWFDLSVEPFASYPGEEWVYVLELTVTDNDAETGTDQVTITLVGDVWVGVY
jgi:hypothetical protein